MLITSYFSDKKNAPLATAIILMQLLAANSYAEFSDRQILADLSLEELSALPVISVTKTEKPVSQAAASIFVVTGRDIHSAGSTTLPEALRLAPNLQVAGIDARNYAITARGFNNPFANKLLVMIDGRTIYSPLFSGVYWDAQDVVLEDLNRIEVVSGAGGTLWGANAVNGVVNIVTRSAAETQGTLISVGASNNEQYTTARYGSSLTNDGYYRVYVKHGQRDDTDTESGKSTDTGWERTQTGFRMDWDNSGEAMTVQGDAYSGRLHQATTEDIKIAGANLLARKNWQLANDSKISLQTYIDNTQRDQPTAFSENMNTIDIALQHEWALTTQQNIVWGAGYRYTIDHIDNGVNFAFLPDNLHMIWKNIFIQDEIALSKNIKLTLGTKWEDNPYTGGESMPGIQLAWSPDHAQLLWGSASRAVRSPSRIDRDLYSPSNPPVVNGVAQYSLNGGPDFVSEIANVYEIGYRNQLFSRVSWSITGFYSEYDKLRTLELNSNGPGLVFKNMAEANTYGMEFWSSWQVVNNWRLHGGLVTQHFDASVKQGSADITKTTSLVNADPNVYWMLRSSYNASENIAVDATLRHVDKLESTHLPAYTALDIRAAWTLVPHLEVSITGQNLLEKNHAEFGTEPGRSEYERTVFAKITWGL